MERKKIIWTNEINDDIMDLSLTCVEVSKKHNISYSTICKKRNNYLKTMHLYDFYIWTDEIIEDGVKNTNLTNKDVCMYYKIEHIKLNPYLDRKYGQDRESAVRSMRYFLGIKTYKYSSSPTDFRLFEDINTVTIEDVELCFSDSIKKVYKDNYNYLKEIGLK